MVVITTPRGYVARFDGSVCVVVATRDVDAAKRFRTCKDAAKWLSKYVDAGYGLSSDSAVIVELP